MTTFATKPPTGGSHTYATAPPPHGAGDRRTPVHTTSQETRMPSVAPARSEEQILTALNVANQTRRHRHDIKRHVRDGEIAILDLLAGPVYEDERLGGMRVRDLLMAVPKIGDVKADKLLQQAKISTGKRIGGLTARQRGALHDEVAGWLRDPGHVPQPSGFSIGSLRLRFTGGRVTVIAADSRATVTVDLEPSEALRFGDRITVAAERAAA